MGEYVDALIKFLNKRSKIFPVDPIRVDAPLLPIFRQEERYYLVKIQEVLDKVIKCQVSRCLWIALTSLLNGNMRGQRLKDWYCRSQLTFGRIIVSMEILLLVNCRRQKPLISFLIHLFLIKKSLSKQLTITFHTVRY